MHAAQSSSAGSGAQAMLWPPLDELPSVSIGSPVVGSGSPVVVPGSPVDGSGSPVDWAAVVSTPEGMVVVGIVIVVELPAELELLSEPAGGLSSLGQPARVKRKPKVRVEGIRCI
ncbi:MAG: hypothetical protein AAGF11_37050 [Myxococcota bacterium]